MLQIFLTRVPIHMLMTATPRAMPAISRERFNEDIVLFCPEQSDGERATLPLGPRVDGASQFALDLFHVLWKAGLENRGQFFPE